MKFLKFLIKLQEIMIYDKKVHNKTLKIFIETFQSYLSLQERQKYDTYIDTIIHSTKKQETIDTYIQKEINNSLNNTLEKLKIKS